MWLLARAGLQSTKDIHKDMATWNWLTPKSPCLIDHWCLNVLYVFLCHNDSPQIPTQDLCNLCKDTTLCGSCEGSCEQGLLRCWEERAPGFVTRSTKACNLPRWQGVDEMKVWHAVALERMKGQEWYCSNSLQGSLSYFLKGEKKGKLYLELCQSLFCLHFASLQHVDTVPLFISMPDPVLVQHLAGFDTETFDMASATCEPGDQISVFDPRGFVVWCVW